MIYTVATSSSNDHIASYQLTIAWYMHVTGCLIVVAIASPLYIINLLWADL